MARRQDYAGGRHACALAQRHCPHPLIAAKASPFRATKRPSLRFYTATARRLYPLESQVAGVAPSFQHGADIAVTIHLERNLSFAPVAEHDRVAPFSPALMLQDPKLSQHSWSII